MATGYYGKKTAEIPDAWIRGAVQGIQIREGLSFPDAMIEAVKRWFEQEELERQFQEEQNQ